jgi:hypothetical protein
MSKNSIQKEIETDVGSNIQVGTADTGTGSAGIAVGIGILGRSGGGNEP